MNMHQPRIEWHPFSAGFYNSMPAVECADAEISKYQKLARASAVLAPIYAAHEVIEFCGINLLHSHWPVENGEIPEQIREPFGKEAHQLVTQPVLKQRGFPASWTVESQGHSVMLRPFEFSSDRGIDELFQTLTLKANFFAEAGTALVSHDLHRDFGICIVAREPLSDDLNSHMVETSEPAGRRSVVKALSPEQVREKALIQTIWRFATAKDSHSGCVLGACITNTICDPLTAPDGSKGAHMKSTSHDKEHEIDPRA